MTSDQDNAVLSPAAATITSVFVELGNVGKSVKGVHLLINSRFAKLPAKVWAGDLVAMTTRNPTIVDRLSALLYFGWRNRNWRLTKAKSWLMKVRIK